MPPAGHETRSELPMKVEIIASVRWLPSRCLLSLNSSRYMARGCQDWKSMLRISILRLPQFKLVTQRVFTPDGMRPATTSSSTTSVTELTGPVDLCHSETRHPFPVTTSALSHFRSLPFPPLNSSPSFLWNPFVHLV